MTNQVVVAALVVLLSTCYAEKLDNGFALRSNGGRNSYSAPSSEEQNDLYAAPARERTSNSYIAPRSEERSNSYAAPSERNSDSYTAPSQRRSDSYTAPSQRRSESYAAPSQRRSDSYTAPSQRRSDSYAAPSQRRSDSYAAPSQRTSDSYAAPSEERSDSYAASRDEEQSDSYGASLSREDEEAATLARLAESIPGRGVPGEDYPILSSIPETDFSCDEQEFHGYYADVSDEAKCQVFHICQEGGKKDSFMCPIGTLFRQEYFVCDWWFNVDCSNSEEFFRLNENIGKIPEDDDQARSETLENSYAFSEPQTETGSGRGYY